MGGVQASLAFQGSFAALSADTAAGYAASGDLRCVADARIDNIAELMSRFDLPAQTGPAALILTLYRRFGAECAALLEGDFAFLLWDGERRQLVGARDRFGVKPLYLASDGDAFAAASDPGRFARHFRSEISAASLASYLAGMVPGDDGTFFRAVKRLPPASLFLREGGLTTIRTYWRLNVSEVSAAPLADHAERLRELLGRSVQKRAVGAIGVGALLSGGLDSSSIAGLLRDRCDRPVPTFSLVHADPRLSEKAHIDAVLELGGFAPQFFDGAKSGPFADLAQLLDDLHEPFLAPNLPAMRPLFAAAGGLGLEVLFDGHGGDEVISHGFALLPRLARNGQWLALWRALAVAETFGQRRMPLFVQHLHSQKRGRSRWLTGPLLGLLEAEQRQPGFLPQNLVDPDFARQTQLAERISAARAPNMALRSDQERHRDQLTAPTQAYGFEILDRLNRACGIEGRYPFWDRELVEFCVSLPVEAKLAEGWSRLVLRRAMEPLLPPSVAWRRDKVDFTPAILRGMIVDPARTVERALAGNSLKGYLDLTRTRECWRQLVAQPGCANPRAVQAIWRFAVLSEWLERRGQAAVSSGDRDQGLAA